MTKTDEAVRSQRAGHWWKPGSRLSQGPIPSELEVRTSLRGLVDASRDCRVSA